MGTKQDKARVALVIGASRGLGRAISLALAERGFDVALGARTVKSGAKQEYWVKGGAQSALPGSLEETAALVEDLGRKAYCVQMDLLDLAGCVSAIDKVCELAGRLDLVVNSAVYQGKGCLKRVLDLDVDEYGKMMLCNVQTPVALFKRALQVMLKQGSGTLVQLSSSSINYSPRFPVDSGGWDFGYASSKSAVSKLMGLLAVEHPVETSGVRCFNVEPGLVVTELMKAGKLADGYSEGFGSVPPEVTGKVIAHLAIAEHNSVLAYNGKSVYAPKLCEKLGLIPGYVEAKPSSQKSKL